MIYFRYDKQPPSGVPLSAMHPYRSHNICFLQIGYGRRLLLLPNIPCGNETKNRFCLILKSSVKTFYSYKQASTQPWSSRPELLPELIPFYQTLNPLYLSSSPSLLSGTVLSPISRSAPDPIRVVSPRSLFSTDTYAAKSRFAYLPGRSQVSYLLFEIPLIPRAYAYPYYHQLSQG